MSIYLCMICPYISLEQASKNLQHFQLRGRRSRFRLRQGAGSRALGLEARGVLIQGLRAEDKGLGLRIRVLGVQG